MKSFRNKKISFVQIFFLSMYLFTTGFSFAAAQGTPCPPNFFLDANSGTCLPNGTTPTGATTNNYTVLAPLPGTTNCGANQNQNCTTDLSTYLPGIFNLMIGVGAISAFVVLTIFGFEYMLTDSLVSKQNARTWVENALWGLGLLIFAYAILYTINPNLVKGSLNITTPNVVSGGSLIAAGTNPCSGSNATACNAEIAAEQTLLASGNVSINGQTNYQCTSANCPTQVGGFTQNTLSDLTALQAACNCTLNITGGSETGSHDATGTHPAGTGVDLTTGSQLTTYLQSVSAGTMPSQPVAGQTYTVTINGQQVKALYEVTGTQVSSGGSTSTGPHWHITF